MAEKKIYGPVYKGFTAMLLGIRTKIFDFKEWDKYVFLFLKIIRTEWWGEFAHYDLGDVLNMIEGYFEQFYLDLIENKEIIIRHYENEIEEQDWGGALEDADEKELADLKKGGKVKIKVKKAVDNSGKNEATSNPKKAVTVVKKESELVADNEDADLAEYEREAKRIRINGR